MKTTLTHLPEDKQDELQTLTKIILEKIPAEMVILFGSHARGDWVEDFQKHAEYESDYDILVITKDRRAAKRQKKWRELDKELAANQDIAKTDIIQHSVWFVNDKIERNFYFFVEILKEGILLFKPQFSTRYSLGVQPTRCLKSRVKCCGYLKPRS